MSRTKREEHPRRVVAKALIFLLIVSVTGLSILADKDQYLPKSDLAHYLKIASKMNVVHSPVVLDRTPLERVAKVILRQPTFYFSRWEMPEIPLLERVGLIVSHQHRSPPSSAT